MSRARLSVVVAVIAAFVVCCLALQDRERAERRPRTAGSVPIEERRAIGAAPESAAPTSRSVPRVRRDEALQTPSATGRVRGVVQDEVGRAIARATVRFEPLGGPRAPDREAARVFAAAVESGEDGRFEATLATDVYFAATASGVARIMRGERRNAVRVQAGELLELEPLVLVKAARLTGLVRDRSGSPVEADLTLYGDQGGSTTRSGPDGRFTMDPVFPGVHALHVEAPGFLLGVLETLFVPELGREVEVVLERAAALEGVARDADTGAPIPAEVLIAQAGRVPAGAWCDASGHFLAAELAVGTAEVFACTRDRARAARVAATLEGGATVKVSLSLAAAPTIGGRVVRSAGEPLEGLEVLARQRALGREARARVDPEGKFVLSGLVDAPHDVTVIAEGGLPFRRLDAVPAGTKDLEVDVPDGARVAGRVLSSGGKPLEATLSVEREWDAIHVSSSIRSGADGSFDAPLPPGRYWIVDRSHPPEIAARFVELAPGQKLADVELVLAPAATVRGRVVDSTGRPVSQVPLGLWRRDARYFHPSVTDEDGRFEIGSLHGGTYVFEDGALDAVAARLGVARASLPATEVTVRPGQVVEIELVLETRAR